MRNLTAIVASIVALSVGGCIEDAAKKLSSPILARRDYESELKTKKHEFNMKLYDATSDFFDYQVKFSIFWDGDLSREKYTHRLNNRKGYLILNVDMCSNEQERDTLELDDEWCAEAQDDLDDANDKLASIAPYEQFEECHKSYESVKKVDKDYDLKSCIEKAVADRKDTFGKQEKVWIPDYARQDFEKYCASPIAKIKALEACVAKLRGGIK